MSSSYMRLLKWIMKIKLVINYTFYLVHRISKLSSCAYQIMRILLADLFDGWNM